MNNQNRKTEGKIEKIKYQVWENLAMEYPPKKEIVEKINEIIDKLNKLSEEHCDCGKDAYTTHSNTCNKKT